MMVDLFHRSSSRPSVSTRAVEWLRRMTYRIFNQSLDDTATYRRRAEDADPGTFRASGSGINFPVGIFLYLIAQLIGGIWWAATMQAKVDSMSQIIIELRQKSEAKNDLQDLQINQIQNGLDERIRVKTRESLGDWGYVHIPRKGE